MRIIENTTEFHLENKSAVALGKFDGIHLGHRRLLERVLEQKSQGLWTVVFTFDTSAASFFWRRDEGTVYQRGEKSGFFQTGNRCAD